MKTAYEFVNEFERELKSKVSFEEFYRIKRLILEVAIDGLISGSMLLLTIIENTK